MSARDADEAIVAASADAEATLAKQLALVIDLDVCVGCHACVTSCKQWNTSGAAGPLADLSAYGAGPTGTFFNRVQTYEAGHFPATDTIHFPKSCLHCQDPPCVPVCPTGASYKRKSDGIVLVDYDKCIGCKYCSWACPYGAREFDEERKVMTKCTLCVDRIYDQALPEADRKPACVKACPTGARLFGDVNDPQSAVSRAIAERGGYALMPEWETNPANRYLPRRAQAAERDTEAGRMNPAWSVVFFTVLAGFGQGLAVALAGAVLAGALAPASGLLRTGLEVSIVLLGLGLGCSFLHLGHPLRAWRAIAMWRTSWLSREVIVLPAFIGVLALWWLALVGGAPAAWLAWALPAAAIAAAALLWLCTGMIYACIRFIQEWAHPITVLNYVLIGLSSGLVLATALAAVRGEAALAARLGAWALGCTLLAALGRLASLRRNAALRPRSTLQSATGIRARRLVQMTMGMSAGSFNTREFFHGLGEAAVRRVRWIALVFGFGLPLLLAAWGVASGAAGPWIAALATQALGLLAERWLFFAQARHPQNLYYQRVG